MLALHAQILEAYRLAISFKGSFPEFSNRRWQSGSTEGNRYSRQGTNGFHKCMLVCLLFKNRFLAVASLKGEGDRKEARLF